MFTWRSVCAILSNHKINRTVNRLHFYQYAVSRRVNLYVSTSKLAPEQLLPSVDRTKPELQEHSNDPSTLEHLCWQLAEPSSHSFTSETCRGKQNTPHCTSVSLRSKSTFVYYSMTQLPSIHADWLILSVTHTTRLVIRTSLWHLLGHKQQFSNLNNSSHLSRDCIPDDRGIRTTLQCWYTRADRRQCRLHIRWYLKRTKTSDRYDDTPVSRVLHADVWLLLKAQKKILENLDCARGNYFSGLTVDYNLWRCKHFGCSSHLCS